MFRSLNAACKYYIAHLAICAHLHNAFSLTVGGSEKSRFVTTAVQNDDLLSYHIIHMYVSHTVTDQQLACSSVNEAVLLQFTDGCLVQAFVPSDPKFSNCLGLRPEWLMVTDKTR